MTLVDAILAALPRAILYGVLSGSLIAWLGMALTALARDGVRPHARYLRYVLLHKLYVYRAGKLTGVSWWRRVVHDWSKFTFSEWRPYVRRFYGYNSKFAPGSPEQLREKRDVEAQFNGAWLHHIHHNPHHWQHWLLQQDDGKLVVLCPHIRYANEMAADWIGAGSKILRRPSIGECVVETVTWYAANAHKQQMRLPVRERVEDILVSLAQYATAGMIGASARAYTAE